MPDGCRGPPAAPSQRPPHGRSGAGPDRSCALRTATRGCPAQQCGGGASQPRQPLLSNGDMPWAALMDRHTGPTAPAVAAASACCSLARNNTVGSSCPHIARTALGRGSRGAAWGRWPLLGCLTHGLRGGGTPGAARRASGAPAAGAPAAGCSPQSTCPSPWTGGAGTPSPARAHLGRPAPARRPCIGGRGGAGWGLPKCARARAAGRQPRSLTSRLCVNPRGVRTGVRGVRRRALGALAHRKRGDAVIRVTPPHLQQAPGGRDEAKRGVVHLRRAVQRVARHDLRARPAPRSGHSRLAHAAGAAAGGGADGDTSRRGRRGPARVEWQLSRSGWAEPCGEHRLASRARPALTAPGAMPWVPDFIIQKKDVCND